MDMKHEETVTETLTRTFFSCDICGARLLSGQRPWSCYVCEREICHSLICGSMRDLGFSGQLDRYLCSICLTFWTPYYTEQLVPIQQEMDIREQQVFALWKQKSLAQKERDHA